MIVCVCVCEVWRHVSIDTNNSTAIDKLSSAPGPALQAKTKDKPPLREPLQVQGILAYRRRPHSPLNDGYPRYKLRPEDPCIQSSQSCPHYYLIRYGSFTQNA